MKLELVAVGVDWKETGEEQDVMKSHCEHARNYKIIN